MKALHQNQRRQPSLRALPLVAAVLAISANSMWTSTNALGACTAPSALSAPPGAVQMSLHACMRCLQGPEAREYSFYTDIGPQALRFRAGD